MSITKQISDPKLDLFTKLAASQEDLNRGEKGKSYRDVLKTARKMIREKKSRD